MKYGLPEFRWFYRIIKTLTGKNDLDEIVHESKHELNIYSGMGKNENYIRIEEILNIAQVAGLEIALDCLRDAAEGVEERNEELIASGVKKVSCNNCGNSRKVIPHRDS